MTLSTVTELKTELDAWLGNSAYSNRYDSFIKLTEARVRKKFREVQMEATESDTLSTELWDLPDDFLRARSVKILTSYDSVLDFIPEATFSIKYADQSTGRPEAYTRIGSQLKFGPAPDTDYDLEVIYLQEVPDLTDSNTSNWVLEKHSDIYLHGCLSFAAAFRRNQEQMNLHNSLFETALDDLIKISKSDRFGDGPLTIRNDVRAV